MQFCTVSLQNWCKQSVFTRSTGCRFEPVATGFYRSGSERFSFFRRLELQLKVQSFPVQSGLSPVFFRSYRPDFKTLVTFTSLQTLAQPSGPTFRYLAQPPTTVCDTVRWLRTGACCRSVVLTKRTFSEPLLDHGYTLPDCSYECYEVSRLPM